MSDRFWSKVDRRGQDECWLWLAAIDRRGYGAFGVGSKVCRAHRIAWTLSVGPIPDGLCVLHRCDNPPCVNPAHLFLGTQLENIKDMDKKRRRTTKRAMGSAHHKAKLTEDHIAPIICCHLAGISKRDLARWFGVGVSTIDKVVHRHTWRHVTVEVSA